MRRIERRTEFPGGVPEWLNGAVSKTVVRLTAYRGFESHPLRLQSAIPLPKRFCGHFRAANQEVSPSQRRSTGGCFWSASFPRRSLETASRFR